MSIAVNLVNWRLYPSAGPAAVAGAFFDFLVRFVFGGTSDTLLTERQSIQIHFGCSKRRFLALSFLEFPDHVKAFQDHAR
jgi:hypothetical protein